MGVRPEFSITDNSYTYKGVPCYIVNVSDKMDLAFQKTDLKFVWAEDYHLGEVYRFASNDELEYFKKYYPQFYKVALGAIRSYVKNPQRFLDIQKSIRASNDAIRKVRMAPIYAQREKEANERKMAQEKAKQERIAKGNYRVETGTVMSPTVTYTNTIVEARKKLYAYTKKSGHFGFIYDNRSNNFEGRIDLIGGELYWTRTTPLTYTPINSDGTLKNMTGYQYRIMLDSNKKLVFAKNLDSSILTSINMLSKINNTTSVCIVYGRENGKFVGTVMKYRKPSGGYTYYWNTGESGRGRRIDQLTGKVEKK